MRRTLTLIVFLFIIVFGHISSSYAQERILSLEEKIAIAQKTYNLKPFGDWEAIEQTFFPNFIFLKGSSQFVPRDFPRPTVAVGVDGSGILLTCRINIMQCEAIVAQFNVIALSEGIKIDESNVESYANLAADVLFGLPGASVKNFKKQGGGRFKVFLHMKEMNGPHTQLLINPDGTIRYIER